MFLDGKSFADAMMVIALGITLSGEKRFLGFVETDTENEKVLSMDARTFSPSGVVLYELTTGRLPFLGGSPRTRPRWDGRIVVDKWRASSPSRPNSC